MLEGAGLSEVAPQAEQQQGVHSEQVEGHQEGGALAGAEEPAQHPHPARPAAP